MVEPQQARYLRLFQLISDTKSEASLQKLPGIENLANIALLQLVADWEGVDPHQISGHQLAMILRQKERLAQSAIAQFRGA